MSGRLVKFEPNGNVSETVWPKNGTPNWETLRDLVGGYIERVQVRYDGKLRQAYANENGISDGDLYNQRASWITDGTHKGVEIVGNLVIWVPDAKVKKVKS
jgi:hypothetical protein